MVIAVNWDVKQHICELKCLLRIDDEHLVYAACINMAKVDSL